MRRELLLPKLGLTMTEGTLVEWMVQPGAAFKAGQSIFVVESEKAANEIGADADGVLLDMLAEVGTTLPCGSVIGYWDDGVAGEAAAAPVVACCAQLRSGAPLVPRVRAGCGGRRHHRRLSRHPHG